MKKLLILLLVLTLGLALVACGTDTPCTEHVDADQNGKCDSCGATVEPESGDQGGAPAGTIELVKGGSATFTIVSTEDTSVELGRTLSNFIKNLNECIEDGNVKAVFEHIPASGAEIIIGNIMLLVSGLGFTNALRDLFTGESFSGILRLLEAVLCAVAIAAGYFFVAFLGGVL